MVFNLDEKEFSSMIRRNRESLMSNEVSFKVLQHLMGAFFYRFWTSAWLRIGKRTESDLAEVKDIRMKSLIRQTTERTWRFGEAGPADADAAGNLATCSENLSGPTGLSTERTSRESALGTVEAQSTMPHFGNGVLVQQLAG